MDDHIEQGVLLSRVPHSETPISLHPPPMGPGASPARWAQPSIPRAHVFLPDVSSSCCSVEVPLTLARVQDLNILEVSYFGTGENN